MTEIFVYYGLDKVEEDEIGWYFAKKVDNTYVYTKWWVDAKGMVKDTCVDDGVIHVGRIKKVKNTRFPQSMEYAKAKDLKLPQLSDLLDIKLSGDSLDAYIGKKYTKQFGNKFANYWGGNRLFSLDMISGNTIGNLVPEEQSDKYKWNVDKELGDYRLGHFYFYASPKYDSEDKAKKNMIKSLMTDQEQVFFKGLGFHLLCILIKNMIHEKALPSNGHVVLEASGGENAKDMEKLVDYYRSLSFVPWSENTRALEDGYKDFLVPMIAPVKGLLTQCKKRKRPF